MFSLWRDVPSNASFCSKCGTAVGGTKEITEAAEKFELGLNPRAVRPRRTPLRQNGMRLQ
jgi:hypothetical protein